MVDRADVFRGIYDNNLWGGKESRSGTGSDMSQTEAVRRELPKLLNRLYARSVLDIPCGDFNWMQHIDFGDIKYIGADVVPDIIADNKAKYPKRDFRVIDIIDGKLPSVSVIFCRDLLGHLTRAEVEAALANIKRSGAEYLVTTTFPFFSKDVDIQSGQWRPINLEHYGYKAKEFIDEELVNDTGIRVDKYLGVYKLRGL